VATNDIRQTGILYPNPYTDYLEGYRDFGDADDEQLTHYFVAPDAALLKEQRQAKMRERFERFLPPFVARGGVWFDAIASSFASALTRFVGDRLLSLRRIGAGGIATPLEPPPGPVAYDAVRAMRQIADEYRIVRSRAETAPELFSLVRNWRAIHLLRGTLNGTALQGTTEEPEAATGDPADATGGPRRFGVKYDIERITRGEVSFTILDNEAVGSGAQAEWMLDVTYPDYGMSNTYNPERPVRFLDIPRILIIRAVNNNALYYVSETLEDLNWYLDYTFPEGRMDGDTFVHDPVDGNVFLDIAGVRATAVRNVDGYYMNSEIFEVTRRDFTPAWVHFQFLLEVRNKVSTVIGMADPLVPPD
jgi:hypothetical protein